jgi:hypothetical protein
MVNVPGVISFIGSSVGVGGTAVATLTLVGILVGALMGALVTG